MHWSANTIWACLPAATQIIGQKMPATAKPTPAKAKTLILPIFGIMVRDCTPADAAIFGLANMAELAAKVRKAKTDASIEKIILLADSPGGQASYCDVLANEVHSLTKEKPVIGYVQGMACSAAYFVISQANKIYLESETSALGSIGALMVHRANTYEKRTVITNEGAEAKGALGSSILTDADRKTAQQELNYLAGIFSGILKKGRPNVSQKAQTGQVFYGAEAVRLGLADGIRPLELAMADTPTTNSKAITQASAMGLNPAEAQTLADLKSGADPYRFCVTARDRELITQRLEKVYNHISQKSA